MRARVYIITALLLCTVDQLSKLAAEKYLVLHNPITVMRGFFDLQLNYNKGIAFGLFSSKTTLFALVALIMVVIITWLIRTAHRDQRLFRWALTFQLGGALGNLIDRALREQGVVDFLNFGVEINGKHFDWPTFNLADMFVVIGTFFLIIYLIKAPPERLTSMSKLKSTPSVTEPSVVIDPNVLRIFGGENHDLMNIEVLGPDGPEDDTLKLEH